MSSNEEQLFFRKITFFTTRDQISSYYENACFTIKQEIDQLIRKEMDNKTSDFY